MSDAELLEFLESQRTLQVATIGKGGFPHLTPMWFLVDEEHKVVFRSFTKSQKIVNLRHDPRLTVLAETGETYSELRGVMIQGEARLVTDRDLVLGMYGALVARYPMIDDRPQQLDPSTLEKAFGGHAEKNTGVIVEPLRTISWDHRKLGGGY